MEQPLGALQTRLKPVFRSTQHAFGASKLSKTVRRYRVLQMQDAKA